MPNKTPRIDQILSLLAETAPRIGELTAGLRPAELRSATVHDEWSPDDVLAHLHACADEPWLSDLLIRELLDQP